MGWVRKNIPVLAPITDAVADVAGGVVDAVKSVGRGIDDLVHDVIPGGWATIGAGALLAVGIYNPSLLAAAESGTLTSGALEAAGVDAAATANAVAAAAPEVVAASSAATASGIAPEIIAAANATTDPIAALNALTGSTTADIGYLQSINASPAIIAAAETNNALLASQAAGGTAGGTTPTTGGTETATGGTTPTTGGTETATGGTTPTTGPATPEPPGTNTQVFDDGSKIVTDANGRIVSVTNADGTNFVPVEDLSGKGIPGLKPGPDNISLVQGAKDYAKAVYDSLGPLGTAALVGGGALAAKSLLTPPNLNGNVGSGNVNYQWGTAPELVNPGLNPGYVMQAASAPHYQSTNPTDAQYYWGVHNAVRTPEQLNNYNNVANAPATPWGAGHTAVGGTAQFDPTAFVNQYIANPSWQGVMNQTGGYTPSQAEIAATSGAVAPTH